MTCDNISGRVTLNGEVIPFLLRFFIESLLTYVDINYYLLRFSKGLSSSSLEIFSRSYLSTLNVFFHQTLNHYGET